MAETEALEPINNLETANGGAVDAVESESVELVDDSNVDDNNEQTENVVPAAKANDFLGDDDSDEDDFVVTIGEIKSNVSFKKSAPTAGGAGVGVAALAGGRPELDGLPSHKGVPIYDLDLATMEDKPWRKPGADLTDYFNYGFNEDTWNQYCERQKKLRSEYGSNQENINRAIFNSISLPMSMGGGGLQQFTAMSGGRQLVNIMAGDNKPKMNKVVIDLSKPPPIMEQSQSPIIRTIITGSGSMSQNLTSMSDIQSSTTQAVVNSALITLGGESNSSPISTITSTGSSNLVSLTGGRSSGAPPPTDFSIPPPAAGAGGGPPPTDFSQPPPNASVADFSMPPPTAAPASDFSKPPPSMMAGAGGSSAIQSLAPAPTALPPPNTSQPPPHAIPSIVKSECPPGVDEPDIPGVSTPPPGISSFGSINQPGSQLGFNPAIPPPGGQMPGMNIPPPSLFAQQQQYMPPASASGGVLYSARPQPLFPPRGNAGYGGGGPMPPGTDGGRGGHDYSREREFKREYSSGDSPHQNRASHFPDDVTSSSFADDAYRRKRRRRSRSVSVDRSSRRRKDDKDRTRDTYTSSSTSRRHDSPHESSATSSSRTASKRKAERSDREKERSSGDGSSKRRGGTGGSSSTRGGAEKETEREKESTDERADRKRKKHDKSEKERDREKS